MLSRPLALPYAFALLACSGPSTPADATTADAHASDSTTLDARDITAPPDVHSDALDTPSADAPTDTATDTTATRDAAQPCATRITYGSAWIHPATHPASFDDVPALVTWDGICTDDASGNSYATLSNGWMPYFNGRGACVINLEYSGACTGVPAACSTRVTYGPAWLHPSGHAAQYDDVAGPLLWDGVCHPSGSQSFAALSNGWTPYFSGSGCEMSFRYEQCGGLYANPVVAADCPDPGVLHDGASYVMVCTSGNAASAFPIRTSSDLVNWTAHGFIFPSGGRPAWASGDFWAPEIHRVGSGYVAYFTARNAADGHLSIGAATATSALGPFTDLGHPLLHDATFGLIDATEFEASDGARYVIWKVDGNAVGQPTPIRIQRLASDGLSVTGSPTTLITNDQAWEGNVVEGPWMIETGGYDYLFYSGNGYASAAYAIGVARATSPLGPFTKASGPIVVSKGAWAGPGHGSVVVGPSGDWDFVYHAWVAGRIGMSPGREVLVDRVLWSGGWPLMPEAPSSRSLPLP